MTHIKICGLDTLENAQIAVNEGADVLGFMFYKESPRYLSILKAKAILKALPSGVNAMGVFVDPSIEEVNEALKECPLTHLQFHGEESPEFCQQFNKPYIKAIRMRDGVDIQGCCELYASAEALLLDTYQKGSYGGTGKVFDWTIIPHNLTKPLYLAGGLNMDNVNLAIAQVKPFAVDVSAGVESSKAVKDPDKITAFIREVRRVEQSQDT